MPQLTDHGHDVPAGGAPELMNAVEAWIFLNPGGSWALPHLYEGDPVDVLFRFDSTELDGPLWRDRLVTSVRACCPAEQRAIADYDDEVFDVFTMPPLVAAWLEWLTDDGAFGIEIVTERNGQWRVSDP
jgi:hypothetical protein